MTFRLFGLAVLLALAGCGGGKPEDAGQPTDQRLEQANRAGTRALAMNQTKEAIKQYRAALTLAYERDDAAAIGDVGYNLAVAQLRAGAATNAARTVREVRAELERRRQAPPAELILVQAAAAYRLGAADEASALAQEVLTRAPLPPETATRAWFIRGAVSADRGDAQGVAQALAAIPSSTQPDQEADRHELAGRAALMSNDIGYAAAAFEQAADQRRLALDYRGMARALSFAGEAVLRQGRTEEAAILFLRAGRSALLQGDAESGRTLLERADSLAKRSGAAGVSAEIERVRHAAGKT